MDKQFPPPTFTSATQFSKARLALLLSQVYVDYFLPVWMDAGRFSQMCDLEDVDLPHSIIALIMEEPVGLALLSRRGARGWISGVGVLPLYRRQGIARRMIQAMQKQAYDLRLETLTLEVLAQNEAGLALYQQLGFHKRRDLSVLTLEAPTFHPGPLPDDLSFSAPEALLAYFDAFRNRPPSWQREQVSLAKRLGRLQGLALRENGRLIGYLLYEEQQKHQAIYDLAVDLEYAHRTSAARRLLLAVHRLRPGVGGYFVNLPPETGLLDAFLQVGYRVWQQQREMQWKVRAMT